MPLYADIWVRRTYIALFNSNCVDNDVHYLPSIFISDKRLLGWPAVLRCDRRIGGSSIVVVLISESFPTP